MCKVPQELKEAIELGVAMGKMLAHPAALPSKDALESKVDEIVADAHAEGVFVSRQDIRELLISVVMS